MLGCWWICGLGWCWVGCVLLWAVFGVLLGWNSLYLVKYLASILVLLFWVFIGVGLSFLHCMACGWLGCLVWVSGVGGYCLDWGCGLNMIWSFICFGLIGAVGGT